MPSCPRCHSERIHQSRRKGIIERGLLTMLWLRPFRCERCNRRFFRLSFAVHSTPSGSATTS